MAERAYLDYYIRNKIIPVKQDVSQLHLHLKRRSLLYHYLHIPPAVVRKRRVLEVGPGTGDNAIYTASLLPDTYTLVDGNPFSLAALKERISNSQYTFSQIPNLEWIECDFLAYQDPRRYDLVLCEGIIPGQRDAAHFLRHAASFVDEGGLLVITTTSATSIFSEVCRRLVKPIFAQRAQSREDLFEELSAFFTPHLQTLPGRSRIIGDWVNDNILQPWTECAKFTIEDAIDAIHDRFDVCGTSPQFIQDFRWYKAAAVDELTLNENARRQAIYWSPLFIDYRLTPSEFTGFGAVGLEGECLAVLQDVHGAWETEDLTRVATCVDRIERVGEMIAPSLSRTATAVRDFVRGTRSLLAGEDCDFGESKSWFGRGQQYVSFLRRN